MSSTVRNTLFTLLMLVLTTIGLNWNKQVARQHDPVTIGRAVLASQATSVNQPDQVFPLEISFSRPIVKLGQSQEVTITTVPQAELDIVTSYPDQSIDHPQTFHAQADQLGRYTFSFRLNDFGDMGVFTTSVVAISGNRSSEASQTFALQPWVDEPELETAENRYFHPLIP